MRYRPDGSLVIAVWHMPPDVPDARANWLPAPQARFQIALRTYLPRQALRSDTARMPVVVRV